MKNWIYILIIGLMGSLVSSCQQSLDEEVQLPITTGKAQITFTIALDDIASRAAWEENEENGGVGTVEENAIDLSTEDGLQVFVYDLQGGLLGEVTNKEIRKVDINTYSFNGQLEIEGLASASLPCRLEVYANCIKSNETFDYDVDYIPMWGTKTTTLQLAKGELTRLTEPIYLLRAMAKVEVRLADGIAEDFDITSVSVDKYNTTGYVLPNFEELKDTELLKDSEVFNPMDNAELGENLDFTSDNNGGFYVYLPEYRNIGAESPAEMTVKIGDKDYTLEFKMYNEEDTPYFNLVRNHYYQYIITGVADDEVEVTMELKYQVMDWTDKSEITVEYN